MAITLFGFKLGKDDEKSKQETQKTFSLPQNDDGAVTIQTGAYYGTYVDLDGTVRNEIELITRYREMSMQPELETAIDEIVNEAIVMEDSGNSVEINTDDLEQPDAVKQKIQDEFEIILRLLNFGNMGHDIFRRWYIDGRLFYHVVIDESSPGKGIQELRYIDPRRIRKIREIQKTRDPKTGMDVIKKENEYYLYNEKGVVGNHANLGAKIAVDSIVNVNSGLMDAKRSMVLSYLHKGIKPLNQLRMVEDACFVADTKVSTPNGIVNISEISAGDEIFCFDIEKNKVVASKVTNQWSNGIKNIVELKTTHHTLKCTSDHRFLTVRKKNKGVSAPVWKTAEELVIGKDYLINQSPVTLGENIPIPDLSRNGIRITNPMKFPKKLKFAKRMSERHGFTEAKMKSFLNGYTPMPVSIGNDILNEIFNEYGIKFDFVNVMIGKSVKPNLPKYVTPEFARLFGFLLGDGYISKSLNKISFAEGVYPEKNELYSNLLEKFFVNKCDRKSSKTRKYTSFEVVTAIGAETLSAMEFKGTAKTKRLPSWIYKASPEIRKEMILGFIDADGYHISGNSYRIELCQKGLLEDIKNVWNSLGLTSGNIRTYTRVQSKNSVCPGNQYTSYVLTLSDSPLNSFDKVIGINDCGKEEVFDIEVDHPDHNFIANGVVAHNCVIYRLSRAPERRIFYVDVGNMSTQKAEQYLRDIMVKYRNKLVYDSNTGEIKDDRKHLSMLEDFWLPRREGSRGTEITTLQGGQNLGEMEDVKYFENKLYKSLGVPISRLEPQQGFSLGRTTEITREELKFNKFVQRLRNKFASMFDELLRVQLVLKNICSKEEWDEFREKIWYDFKKDNNFSELKEAELLTNRLSVLQIIDPYVGKYYSMEWVRRNVLMLNDEEIEEINQQIQQDMENAPPPVDEQGNPIPGQQPGQMTNQVSGQVPGEEEQEPLPPKFQVQPNEVEFI